MSTTLKANLILAVNPGEGINILAQDSIGGFGPAANGGNVLIQGGHGAGTGNGGNLTLAGGTSSGGLPGNVIVTGANLVVPAGDGLDAGGGNSLTGNLAVGFSSSIMYSPGTTGWKIVPTVSGSRDWLELYVQNRQVIAINSQTSPSTPRIDISLTGQGGGVTNLFRTDGGAWDLGTNTGGGHGSWQQVWADSFVAGNTTTTGRNIYFTTLFAGNPVPGISPWGIGFDNTTGREFYLGLYQGSGPSYTQCFNVICDTTTSTLVSAPANAVADSSNAISITVKGSDKTAGTGNGGNLVLAGGTSVGGLAGGVIVNGSLKSGHYHLEPKEFDAGNSGSTLTIDLDAAASQKITMTASCTFTITNPEIGGTYVLKIVQDGTGGWAITWPATVKWPSNTIPTFDTTAAHASIVTLYWDGTDYFASAATGYVP